MSKTGPPAAEEQPRPITAVELGTLKLSQDDFQGLFGSTRIGARTETLQRLGVEPIIVRVYKDESLPMEVVFGDDCPKKRGEIAFGTVFGLKANERNWRGSRCP